jgi:hypothetical protein
MKQLVFMEQMVYVVGYQQLELMRHNVQYLVNVNKLQVMMTMYVMYFQVHVQYINIHNVHLYLHVLLMVHNV